MKIKYIFLFALLPACADKIALTQDNIDCIYERHLLVDAPPKKFQEIYDEKCGKNPCESSAGDHEKWEKCWDELKYQGKYFSIYNECVHNVWRSNTTPQGVIDSLPDEQIKAWKDGCENGTMLW